MSDGSSDARYEMERGGWHINSTPKKNPIKKKRKCPWFWRRQCSCPDCGYIFGRDGSYATAHMTLDERGREVAFTCPRCKAHYSSEEFWTLNQEKYDRTADLSEEFAI